jgi:hypothetical protein
LKPSKEIIINEWQKKIDELNIKGGFPEAMWKYCLFSEEKYNEKCEKAAEDLKKNHGMKFKFIPREIIVPKLVLEEGELCK